MMGWLSALDKLAQLALQVLGLIRDAKLRQEGRNEVVLADARERAKGEARELEAANNTSTDTVDDSLRDGKF
jgi:hypothetical protein